MEQETEPATDDIEAPIVETSESGHVQHDGTLPGEPHAIPIEQTSTSQKSITSLKTEDYHKFEGKLMHELTPKERAKMWEKAYRENVGEHPPPGYLQAMEQEFQNILKSIDEPRVQILTVRGLRSK